jgi:hypothetical protein
MLFTWGSCVIPIEPEFSNPSVNHPPYVSSSSPGSGTILTFPVDATAPPSIEVRLADQNVRDVLYVRWLVNYSPAQEQTTHPPLEMILPSTGRPERTAIRFSPSCLDDRMKASGSTHRIVMAVSDRPFVAFENADPLHPWDSIAPEAFLLEMSWGLEMMCQ